MLAVIGTVMLSFVALAEEQAKSETPVKDSALNDKAKSDKPEKAGKSEKAITAEQLKSLEGSWSGTWVDNWHYAGQGGKLTGTFTAGDGSDLKAEFKAPGFIKDSTKLTFKIKAEDDGYSSSGAIEMGKPAGTLVFKIKISGDKLTGDYESPEERGTFEMTKK
jgi:hypothetical protein